jgi:signal transduction histidine kinase
LRLLALIVTAVFISEALIMLTLRSVVPRLEVWAEATLDAGLLVALLMPALYVLMVRPLELEISTRRKSEAALQEARDELEQRVQERTLKIYEQAQRLATLEERQRLARELHDSLSQVLYGIALGAHTALTLLDRDRGRVVEALDYVLSLADAGLTEMRALIFELRPESLKLEGLVTALSKQAAAIRARRGLEVEADLCPEPEVAFEIKEALYRIAQEALHNAVKHAQASRLTLSLRSVDHHLILEVTDDGVGFDPAVTYPGHLGLRSMAERAARLNGHLQIHSQPGGTRVRAQFRC